MYVNFEKFSTKFKSVIIGIKSLIPLAGLDHLEGNKFWQKNLQWKLWVIKKYFVPITTDD